MSFKNGDWVLILWINAGESLHPKVIEGFPTEEAAEQAGQKWKTKGGPTKEYCVFHRPNIHRPNIGALHND